jgi:hypothetical protein
LWIQCVGVLLWTSKIWYCVGSYLWMYCFEQVKYDTVWSYVWMYCFEQVKCNTVLCWILCVDVLLWTSKIWYCVGSYGWLFWFEQIKDETFMDPMFVCIALDKYNMILGLILWMAGLIGISKRWDFFGSYGWLLWKVKGDEDNWWVF